MITLGVLILLFVAYQLWGTGIREAQAQNRLEKQFNNANFPTTQAKSSDEDPPTVGSGRDGDAPGRHRLDSHVGRAETFRRRPKASCSARSRSRRSV